MQIVWVTNLSAPYRRPMWSALACRADLSVGLLARTEPNRQWTDELPAGVRRLAIRAWQLNVWATSLYILLASGLGASPVDAVILPGWEHPAAWQLLLTCKLRGRATVAFYESTGASQHRSRGLAARARRRFFRRVDSVLTVGSASRQAVIDLGVAADRIVTTHNSIDAAVFAPALPSPNRQAELSGRGDRLIYVGQLIERKNVAALLHALLLVPKAISLDVVGAGPLEDGLRALAETLGLKARVTFSGYLEPEELRQRLAFAGTLVLPSTEEVYGLAPAEALAVGAHTVVSARAGIAEDIEKMAGVWIAEPTPEALAAAILSSTLTWSGPIVNPEICQWTPARFADDVMTAVELAMARRRSPRD